MPKQKDHAPPESRTGFPAEDLRIFPMRAEHLGEVVRIERLSFSKPWPASYFLQEITRNPLSYLYVVKDLVSGEIAGYVVFWIVRGQEHINNLAVAPEWRGRGCGEMLLRRALETGWEAGCRSAVLEVRKSNVAAIRLYRRLGFRTAGEIPKYYSNGEDALVLSLQIAGKHG